MIKKDLLVLWRHKPRLASILLFPILMIALFGYGMGGEIENIPVVVVKQTDGPVTDATLNAIKEMSLYDVKDIISDPQRGREMVETGQIKQLSCCLQIMRILIAAAQSPWLFTLIHRSNGHTNVGPSNPSPL